LKHDLLSGMLKTVKEKRLKSNVKDRVAAYTELVGGDCGFDSRLLRVQQLIPIQGHLAGDGDAA